MQTYEEYPSLVWNSIVTALPFALISGVVVGIAILLALLAMRTEGNFKRKLMHSGIAALGGGLFIGLMAYGGTYHDSVKTVHVNILEENLSKKYEFDGMRWVKVCQGRSNCNTPSQPEAQDISLQINGTPQTYILTQDPETNEPFLKDPFTGQEPVDIKK